MLHLHPFIVYGSPYTLRELRKKDSKHSHLLLMKVMMSVNYILIDLKDNKRSRKIMFNE